MLFCLSKVFIRLCKQLISIRNLDDHLYLVQQIMIGLSRSNSSISKHVLHLDCDLLITMGIKLCLCMVQFNSSCMQHNSVDYFQNYDMIIVNEEIKQQISIEHALIDHIRRGQRLLMSGSTFTVVLHAIFNFRKFLLS